MGLAGRGVTSAARSSRLLQRGPAPGASGVSANFAGPEFALEIAAMPVNFTGQASTATVVNGSLPAPLLRMREGDIVAAGPQPSAHLSAIHWHGLILPADMDGVPGLSFHGIEPVKAICTSYRCSRAALRYHGMPFSRSRPDSTAR